MKRADVEERFALLSKRVTELQKAHDRLAHRNQLLEQHPLRLVSVRPHPHPRGQHRALSLFGLNVPAKQGTTHRGKASDEEEQYQKFSSLVADMFNLFRDQEETKLTAKDCMHWYRDAPKKLQALHMVIHRTNPIGLLLIPQTCCTVLWFNLRLGT